MSIISSTDLRMFAAVRFHNFAKYFKFFCNDFVCP